MVADFLAKECATGKKNLDFDGNNIGPGRCKVSCAWTFWNCLIFVNNVLSVGDVTWDGAFLYIC